MSGHSGSPFSCGYAIGSPRRRAKASCCCGSSFWPRKKITRCSRNALRMAAIAWSSRDWERSIPLISAPRAPAMGWISIMVPPDYSKGSGHACCLWTGRCIFRTPTEGGCEMPLIKPLLVSFSLLAFAGAAVAADDAQNKGETEAQSSSSMHSGTKASAGATKERTFASMDTNKDGSSEGAELAANADLAAKFKDADKNSDGKRSRSEYDAMAKAEGGAAAGGSTSMKKEEKKPAK